MTAADAAHALLCRLQPLVVAWAKLCAAFEHHTAQEEGVLRARTLPAVEGAMRGLEDELRELDPKQTRQSAETA